jgi:hypothetical protein
VAASAGIDDTQDLVGSWDSVSIPNLKTIEVELLGPMIVVNKSEKADLMFICPSQGRGSI